jgi:hypothetical protein
LAPTFFLFSHHFNFRPLHQFLKLFTKGRLEGGDVKQSFDYEENQFFNGAEDGKGC